MAPACVYVCVRVYVCVPVCSSSSSSSTEASGLLRPDLSQISCLLLNHNLLLFSCCCSFFPAVLQEDICWPQLAALTASRLVVCLQATRVALRVAASLSTPSCLHLILPSSLIGCLVSLGSNISDSYWWLDRWYYIDLKEKFTPTFKSK